MKHSWSLLLCAGLVSGCSGLRQPPLPKASTTAVETPLPPIADAGTARLRAADAIYFSLTKSSTAPGQPLWEVVQTLQNGGQQVALGWAELPATEQPRFDAWQRQEISSAQLLGELVRPERAAILRPALRPDLGQVALGTPRSLLGKIRDGAALTAEEEAQVPTGFRVKGEAFEDFADRVAGSPRWHRFNLRRLYRAHLVAEQTIAAGIVRFHRDHPAVRLLVLLPNDAMIDPREVADFADQQMPLRQLILDRTKPLEDAQPQLVQL